VGIQDTHPKPLVPLDSKSARVIALKSDLDPKIAERVGLKTGSRIRWPRQGCQLQALASILSHHEIFLMYSLQIFPAPTVRLEDKVLKLARVLLKAAHVPLHHDKSFLAMKVYMLPWNDISS